MENIQATKAAIKADESGIVPAWSTQLAEVALPISYKLKNIEATERIASQAGEAVTSSSNIASMYRFNTQERAPKVHPSMAGFDASGNNAAQKRPLKSSDDYALEQYKKVIYLFVATAFFVFLLSLERNFFPLCYTQRQMNQRR